MGQNTASVCVHVSRPKVVTFGWNSDPVEEPAESPGSVGLASCRQPHCADADGAVDPLWACRGWGEGRGGEGEGMKRGSEGEKRGGEAEGEGGERREKGGKERGGDGRADWGEGEWTGKRGDEK